MEYTVQQLAKLSGVSKRTLHYYDEIDLLKPKAIRSNGYRIYGSEEVTRLQQILFFKSFGLSLIEIQTIMAQDKVTIYQTLQSQQKKSPKLRCLDAVCRGHAAPAAFVAWGHTLL